MPSFKVIDDVSNIKLSSEWTDPAKFNSKGRTVGENGKPITSSCKGKQYRLISKKERYFTTAERIGRGFFGVVAAVFTLGIAVIFSKTVRNLFTQEKKKIRFALIVPFDQKTNHEEKKVSTESIHSQEETVEDSSKEHHSSVEQDENARNSSSLVTLAREATDRIPDSLEQLDTKDSVDPEYALSEQELRGSVDITEATISKIQTCMKNVLNYKEGDGVKLYNSQHNHRVFSLETAPEYIFKMKGGNNCFIASEDDSMKARYQAMINAQTVCRTHQLGLLVIPNAKLFTVEAEGEKYEIIAEKKLDLNPSESAQEQYFEEYASSLDETIRQLAVFICQTGYSDVKWGNNPILNDAPDELGRRKIGLIDIEEMSSKTTGLFGKGWGRRGLVRCVTEEQGKIVEGVAKKYGVSTSSFESAHERRKEEIEDAEKLKDYYSMKNITTGFEPLQVDEDALAFPDYPVKTQELKDLTLQLIKTINEQISAKSSNESAKGKRYIFITVNRGPFSGLDEKLIEPGVDKWETANAFKTDEEYYNATYLGHIVKKLLDLGVIYKLVKRNHHGYFIQA